MSDSQIEKLQNKMEEMVDEEGDDRVELAKLFVHIAKARRDAVQKIMNRWEKVFFGLIKAGTREEWKSCI